MTPIATATLSSHAARAARQLVFNAGRRNSTLSACLPRHEKSVIARRHGELHVGHAARRSSPFCSYVRGFHSTGPSMSAGESDSELSARLGQEIAYEHESAAALANEAEGAQDSTSEPVFLSTFRKQGVWKIEDQPGSDEIALTREFGNEHIRVLFSIGDIDSSENEIDEAEDDIDGKDEDENPAFPVRCAITISKPSQGALTIDAQAIDGAFSIQNISFYKDAKLATELTAEADWARRGLYIGPQFETLDESVQAQFESFLEERGIATDLALFVPNFAEFKEQREYCAWLENVKTFVDA